MESDGGAGPSTQRAEAVIRVPELGRAAGVGRLEFYGGMGGLLLPFAVMLGGILWLGVTERGLPEAFWPWAMLGLLVGLVLAKRKQAYIDAMIGGIASPMLAIILLAWFLAGVMGALLSAAGLVDGLVWLGIEIGVSAGWFPLIVFVATALLSISTGTSIGSILATAPILLPVGFELGADPLWLTGAVVGGAFVGDNIAPISDTTIVSAYTQGTTVAKVVTSRLKYAAVAGAITIVVYVIVALAEGGAATPSAPEDLDELGLIMLAVPALLITLMVRGRHMVEALLYSTAFGIVLALVTGLIGTTDILTVNKEEFTAGGFVIDGVNGFIGVAVFTILLFGLIGVLVAGRMIDWLVDLTRPLARSATSAETTIYGVTLAANALTAAGTPSMVMLGSYVRRLGHRFRIAPWRRANIFDAASTTLVGILPYSAAVLIPFALVGDQVTGGNYTPTSLVPYVVYCWALIVVMLFAVLTGWGREYSSDAEWEIEAQDLSAAGDGEGPIPAGGRAAEPA